MEPKERKRLLKLLEQHGWRVERHCKHFKAYPPDKRIPHLVMPRSSSSARGRLNLFAEIKKRGGAQILELL